MGTKGVIFDLDGVVVELRLDFAAIKREMFGSAEGYILERLEGLHGEERRRAEAVLRRHEDEAAHRAQPVEGVLPLLAWLRERGLKTALVTRNSRRSVNVIEARLGLHFPVVVTREDAPPKPSPQPILLACQRMRIQPEEAMFLGDGEFDLLAGRRAGVTTVLLRNPAHPSSEHADFVIGVLSELPALILRDHRER